jgi:hypothetical protein
VWAILWVLYLSFVNIGQTFYSFGWEILLCEIGFLAIFAGSSRTQPNAWLRWMWRWTLFRLMLGAGLIKVRGDICWVDLTCLDYYYETQPMPNPLSWYFTGCRTAFTRRASSSITSSNSSFRSDCSCHSRSLRSPQ